MKKIWQTPWHTLRKFSESIHYYKQNKRRLYPLRLLPDYRTNEKGEVIIKIRQFGNQSPMHLPVYEIYKSDQLLEKFHPRDISRISLLTLGELIFQKNNTSPERSFEQLKEKIFASMEHS